nr:BREX-1 system adenine-specific DNA-methyltransferase PglX [Leucobacter insecticola]
MNFNPRQGLSTADNGRFLRSWWEVSRKSSLLKAASVDEASLSSARWFLHNKGGEFRKWWGNQEHLVNWSNDGQELRACKPKAVIRSPNTYFQTSISWSNVSTGDPAFREYPIGFTYNGTAPSIFFRSAKERHAFVAFANSSVARRFLQVLSPTLHFESGQIAQLPIISLSQSVAGQGAAAAIQLAKEDWDDFETSWDFERPSWLGLSEIRDTPFGSQLAVWSVQKQLASHAQKERETENNAIVAKAYGLENEVPIEVPLHRVSLTRNVEFRYGPGKSAEEYAALERADVVAELISYAVGCMFGRYSLDEPGLVLADAGSKLQDYLAKVPEPSFMPDTDNVIPFVDGEWFSDDIVARFRKFLRVAFGEEHFEENLNFVTESLGVNELRDYFITKAGKSRFYDDHVQRYKKRPIYWMFASSKGSFNALIYMHRYTPSTVSTVLNEYLRDYRSKLELELERVEEAATAGSAKDRKEAERLRKVLVELAEYERDVLYPLATRQLPIDLDDGVLVNYLRFGKALKNIGLEPKRKEVETWTWPVNALEPLNE